MKICHIRKTKSNWKNFNLMTGLKRGTNRENF